MKTKKLKIKLSDKPGEIIVNEKENIHFSQIHPKHKMKILHLLGKNKLCR